MKTIKKVKDSVETKIYQARDGKQFENKNDCKTYEKRIKKIDNVKKSFMTVFNNGDDVYNSLCDGLNIMLETDRKNVLNGLINLTIRWKK